MHVQVTSGLLALAAFAALAAGCGDGDDRLTTQPTAPGVTAGTASASPVPENASPTPTNTARPSPDPAHLTEADAGRTIRVDVGDEVNVELPGGPDGGFHQPVSSGDAMHRTSASGGYPSEEPARAGFVAVRAGSADLTAYDDFACLHASPSCLPPQRQWIVHVVVRTTQR